MEKLTAQALTGMREPTTKIVITPEQKQRYAARLELQTFGDANLLAVEDACMEWLAAFDDQRAPCWISLVGASGTGKTHCAKRLWKYAQPRADFSRTAYVPKWFYWPDFVDELRSGNAYEQFNDLKKWPLLFLDDIGAERDPSGFAAEKLNTLLGCRMDRWTILTSNKDFDALAAVDGRISSRLIRGQNICVGIKTQDFSTR